MHFYLFIKVFLELINYFFNILNKYRRIFTFLMFNAFLFVYQGFFRINKLFFLIF